MVLFVHHGPSAVDYLQDTTVALTQRWSAQRLEPNRMRLADRYLLKKVNRRQALSPSYIARAAVSCSTAAPLLTWSFYHLCSRSSP